MPNWSVTDIPDQSGRVALVTGASSGIGAEAAVALAARGAQTILAVRNQARGDAVRDRILRHTPGANVLVSLLDMADLASIRAFAERIAADLPQVDILLNNAGLSQASRGVTADGFERIFGTNHLGHFALTGLLIPALLRAPAPRVVTIASLAHLRGHIDFDDLQSERRYAMGRAYAQSKLANLMFALELAHRARAAGSRLASLAAHPGLSSTGFLRATGLPTFKAAAAEAAFHLLGQNAAAGALPGLFAATMKQALDWPYWGPGGVLEFRGKPASARMAPKAMDEAASRRLWSVSEQLTGVVYPALA